MVSDPDILQQIYITNFSQFGESFSMESDDPIDTSNLLVQSGDDWKRTRSAITTIFTTNKLRNMTTMMNPCMKKLDQILEDHATNGKDFFGETVFSISILDFVVKCFYGLDIDVYSDKNQIFVKSAKGILGGATAWNMLLSENLPSWLMSVVGTTLANTDSAAYFTDMVKKTIAQRTDADKHRQDLVQLMIEARDKNENNETKGLNEYEVISNAITFFAVGFDTSKNTAALFLYNMAKYPDVQEKVYQELRDKLGDKPTEELTYDDYSALSYLEATIQESLRIFSIDCRGFRQATVDTTIPNSDVKLPKGTRINIPFYAVHFDERNFEEPQKLIPERFLEKDRVKPCTMLSFGAGPRYCIGQRFAMLSIKITLANVLRNYRIEKSASTPEEFINKVGYFMTEPSDIAVKLVKRK